MINKEKINKARQSLIDLALEEICSDDFGNFYRHIYYVIAKLGLQRKAEEENLFIGKDWSNPHCKEDLIKELKEFLIRHIR